MTTFHFIVSPRGWTPPDPPYRSLFGFIWWFWIPRLHTQHPDQWNPKVVLLIWLCFAAGIEIWRPESKGCWPSKQQPEQKKP